jgi:hypothetical protein
MCFVRKGALEKCSITKTLKGVPPPPLWLPPIRYPPQPGNNSLALNAGTVWGDRHCPLLHRTSMLFFLSLQKGIPKSPKMVTVDYFDTHTNDEALYQYTKITPKLKVLREQISDI